MKMKQQHAELLPLISANDIKRIIKSIDMGHEFFIKTLKTFLAKYERKQRAVNYYYQPE